MPSPSLLLDRIKEAEDNRQTQQSDDICNMSTPASRTAAEIADMVKHLDSLQGRSEQSSDIETATLRGLLCSLGQTLPALYEALGSSSSNPSSNGSQFRSLRETLESCKRTLSDVCESPVEPEVAGNQEKLKSVQLALLNHMNALTLNLHLELDVKCNQSTSVPEQVHSIQTALDNACKWLYGQEIFPPAPAISIVGREGPTFNLHEAEVASSLSIGPQNTYVLVCPRAGLPRVEEGIGRVDNFRFVCHCETENHESSLAYNVLPNQFERSIPVEEIGEESYTGWEMVLRKRDAVVSVRLSSLLPTHIASLEAWSAGLARAFYEKMIASCRISELLTISQKKVSVLRMKVFATLVRFPIRSVKFVYTLGARRREFTLDWTPVYWQFFHHATTSRESLEAFSGITCDSLFLEEPYFVIFISQQRPMSKTHSKDEPLNLYKVRVCSGTVIRRINSKCAVITNVDCINEGKSPFSLHCAEVHFEFDDSRVGASTFAEIIDRMQKRLVQKTRQRPFWGEKVVYRHTSDVLPSASVQAGARVNIVYSPEAAASSKYRCIVTYGDDNGTMCFDLGPTVSPLAFDGLGKPFTSRTVWVVDRTSFGPLSMKRQSWNDLQNRARSLASQVRSTGEGEFSITRERQTSSENWFEELEQVQLVLRAQKRLIKNDKEYEPVKIAVIDTGLKRDIVRGDSETIVAYKDFVAAKRAKDGKGIADKDKLGKTDDSRENMRDEANPLHGTNVVRLILKVYKDAKLYIARVLDQNQGKSTIEPYLIADAINWAIKHKVDIINISAGFKTCPIELYEAAFAAHAAKILVFASPGNWSRKDTVAFPAAIQDHVLCIFSTNGGLTNTREFNPAPRKHAHNFGMLGEDVDVGGVPFNGTSAATAIASGFAARIIDFSRQPDCRGKIENVRLLQTKTGMTAVFAELSSPDGDYECIRPLRILGEVNDGSGGINSREAVIAFLSSALKKAR